MSYEEHHISEQSRYISELLLRMEAVCAQMFSCEPKDGLVISHADKTFSIRTIMEDGTPVYLGTDFSPLFEDLTKFGLTQKPDFILKVNKIHDEELSQKIEDLRARDPKLYDTLKSHLFTIFVFNTQGESCKLMRILYHFMQSDLPVIEHNQGASVVVTALNDEDLKDIELYIEHLERITHIRE